MPAVTGNNCIKPLAVHEVRPPSGEVKRKSTVRDDDAAMLFKKNRTATAEMQVNFGMLITAVSSFARSSSRRGGLALFTYKW